MNTFHDDDRHDEGPPPQEPPPPERREESVWHDDNGVTVALVVETCMIDGRTRIIEVSHTYREAWPDAPPIDVRVEDPNLALAIIDHLIHTATKRRPTDSDRVWGVRQAYADVVENAVEAVRALDPDPADDPFPDDPDF